MEDFFLPFWMFDVVIFVMLIVLSAVIVELVVHWQKSSKRWLEIGLFVVAIVGWALIFYGSFIEPKMLLVRERQISLNQKIVGSARIGLFADLHTGRAKKSQWTQRVVDRVNELNLDALLIPGDFIYSSESDIQYSAPLSNLQVPTFIVMGNHDQEFGNPDTISTKLDEWGITVLRNSSRKVELNGVEMDIVGIDDIWFTPDPVRAFENTSEETPTIFLAHNPDIILDAYASMADLIVSGHTHGGQIRLPFIGPLAGLPTELGRAFDRGLFELDGGRLLFITQGVGESGPRARLFAPPTIDVLNLTF